MIRRVCSCLAFLQLSYTPILKSDMWSSKKKRNKLKATTEQEIRSTIFSPRMQATKEPSYRKRKKMNADRLSVPLKWQGGNHTARRIQNTNCWKFYSLSELSLSESDDDDDEASEELSELSDEDSFFFLLAVGLRRFGSSAGVSPFFSIYAAFSR